ncbi:DNA-processing protein DprA [Pelistega europaea]|uniref:DNA-protecting protein DprA n=1 Tax=Pelistega europaea TaxID=106147 RepID=A0A7Y4LA86_9BURK|nr:DNA-processing protein DprA [Pelistega europaea]NOL48712.1 DNA-protecting protein DprA [Pelistega europaea]
MPITSPNLSELHAWLRLTLEPGLGAVSAKNLLMRFGLPEAIFEAKMVDLGSIVGEKMALQLKAPCSEQIQSHIDKTLVWLEQDDHHILTLADQYYPKPLLDTHDPPVLLYVDGQLAVFEKLAMAIVGTRNATLGGEQNARAFGKYIAQQDWCVVSGLAQGIDGAAHEGALSSGKEAATVAVMGTGINRIYPAHHRDLALRIKHQGALVTEYPLDTRAQPFQFPARNRIVAGLSKGVVVVEAAQQSGSLITARMAGEIGREVFAIPGSIHSPVSRGCHQLIRQGAKLVETGQDIIEELGYLVSNKAPQPDELSKKGNIPIEFRRILDMIGFDATPLTVIQQSLGLSDAELSTTLMNMELQGLLVRLADGRYQQVHGE